MPYPQTTTPPPVSVGRRPKKKTPAPQPPATPPPLPERTQQLNNVFGRVMPGAVTQPPEFTSQLPDPPVVGLTTPPAPGRRDIALPPPRPVPPPELQTNTPGQMLAPELGAAGPPPPMPVQQADPYANESPTDRMVREAAERLQAANQEQPRERKGIGGRIRSGLESFVIEAGRPFRNQMPRDERELAYGLGRGISGGVYGAVNSEYPSQVRIESKRQLAGQQYDQALVRQTAETQNRLRDAQAEYASGRGVREDRKLEIQSLLNQAKLRQTDRSLDERERNNRSIADLRKRGLINQEEELELRRLTEQHTNEDRDAAREQRDRQFTKKFDADERDRKIKNNIAARRATAYEAAVAKSGSGSSSTKAATAAAEAEVYDEAVMEIESDIQELERAVPADERAGSFRTQMANLERQLRDNRLKAEKARATAGQQTDASRTNQQLSAIETEEEVRRIAADKRVNADAAVARWKKLRMRAGK